MSSKFTFKAPIARWHPGRAANSGVVLNHDILRHVLLFVETHKDLLAVMSTCHALYDAGIQPLVRLPITIDEDTIGSFHDFMLSHAPATFLAFRALHIYGGGYIELCPEDNESVVELLKRGTKLRQLTLPYNVFYGHEGFGEAVACLKGLEELAIAEGGYYTGIPRVLTQLHSPLAKINIQFEFEECYVEGEPILDPVLLLANFQNTLERATIFCAPFFTVDFCYPKLLDLELHLSGGPSLSVLAAAFPNLQTLFVRSNLGEAELTDLRNQNIAFQDGHKCWEALTSVDADSDALYAMGLKNTLKSVTIAPIKSLTSVRRSFLPTVISTTQTEALSLDLPGMPGILLEVLSDMRKPLVSLELDVGISKADAQTKTLDELFKGLKSVTAVMLHLTLRVPDTASVLDERTLVAQIGASMCNVACIYLDLGGRRASYWMNTAFGTEKKEWARALLNKDVVGGGLRNFLGHIISMGAVSIPSQLC